MYQRSYTWSEDQDVRACSYCDRPGTRETDVRVYHGPAIYSCSTCGQREAVTWRSIPRVAPRLRAGARYPGVPAGARYVHWVEEVEVVEEPHIILGED